MIDLVARILVALATAAATVFGTSVVATEWAAGPGHAASATGALVVCLLFAATTVLLLLGVALDLHDAHQLRIALGERRRVLDRLSVIG